MFLKYTRIFAAFILLTLSAVFISGCRASDKVTVESIEKKLTENITFPEMVSLNEKQLLNYYTFPADSFADFSVNLAKEEEKSDEYAIFLLNKDTAETEILNAISLHSGARTISFKQFPSEEQKLQNSIIRTDDRFIVYVVTAQSDLAAELLEEMGLEED